MGSGLAPCFFPEKAEDFAKVVVGDAGPLIHLNACADNRPRLSEPVSLRHCGHFLGGESGVAPDQRADPIVVVILRVI